MNFSKVGKIMIDGVEFYTLDGRPISHGGTWQEKHGPFECSYDEKPIPPNRHQIDLCWRFLEEQCEVTKTIRLQRSSYGWKHQVEKWCRAWGPHEYISNGAFIHAAIENGIRCKVYKEAKINVLFAMSYTREAPHRLRGVGRDFRFFSFGEEDALRAEEHKFQNFKKQLRESNRRR